MKKSEMIDMLLVIQRKAGVLKSLAVVNRDAGSSIRLQSSRLLVEINDELLKLNEAIMKLEIKA